MSSSTSLVTLSTLLYPGIKKSERRKKWFVCLKIDHRTLYFMLPGPRSTPIIMRASAALQPMSSLLHLQGYRKPNRSTVNTLHTVYVVMKQIYYAFACSCFALLWLLYVTMLWTIQQYMSSDIQQVTKKLMAVHPSSSGLNIKVTCCLPCWCQNVRLTDLCSLHSCSMTRGDVTAPQTHLVQRGHVVHFCLSHHSVLWERAAAHVVKKALCRKSWLSRQASSLFPEWTCETRHFWSCCSKGRCTEEL